MAIVSTATGDLARLSGLIADDGSEVTVGDVAGENEEIFRSECPQNESISGIGISAASEGPMLGINATCTPDPMPFSVQKSGAELAANGSGIVTLIQSLRTQATRDEDPVYDLSSFQPSDWGCFRRQGIDEAIPPCVVFENTVPQSQLTQYFFTVNAAAVASARSRALAMGQPFSSNLVLVFPFSVASPFVAAVAGNYNITINTAPVGFLIGPRMGEPLAAECPMGSYLGQVDAGFSADALHFLNISCSNGESVTLGFTNGKILLS